jgi:hypothetical protein
VLCALQDAAKLKAELKELEALLGPPSVDSDTNLQTRSDTLTCDVRVKIVRWASSRSLLSASPRNVHVGNKTGARL